MAAMECPKCGQRAGFEAQESCDGCGLVFSKWRPGGGAIATENPALKAAPRASESSGVSLESILLFLSVSAYYAVRVMGAEGKEERESIELSPEKPGGAVKNPCYLEGEVLDIHSLAPVAGAQIAFDPRFASVTDDVGRYQARVTAGQAYTVTFTHNEYWLVPIDGFSRDWRGASLEQREAAARLAVAKAEAGVSGPSGEYRCEKGATAVYNFGLARRSQ